jgi:hypothetical protein
MEPIFWIRRFPSSVSIGVSIIIAAFATRSIDLIDDKTLVGVLLTGECAAVLLHFGSAFFRKRFAIQLFQAAVTCLLWVFMFSVAAVTGWETIDLLFGQSVVAWEGWYQQVDVISQRYTVFVLYALVLTVFMLWRNRKKQLRHIDSTQKLIAETLYDLSELERATRR